MGHTSQALRSCAGPTLAALGFAAFPGVVRAGHDNHNLIPAHAGHITWLDGGDHHQHHFHATDHDANPHDAVAGHDVAHQSHCWASSAWR